MDFSLTKLRYVVAVAKAQSYSRAADQLNVSQPALSRTIAAIEAHYGVTIFERGRMGARPTLMGAQIVSQIEALLRNADSLDYNLQLFGRGEVGRLSLGLGPHIASLFLPRLGREVMTAKPRIMLRTVVRPPDSLMQELINNQIDLFVSPDYHDEVPPEIEIQGLGSVSISLMVRAEHPLAKKAGITFADVAHWPFATTTEARWPGDPGLFICDSYYVMREIVLESDVIWICAPQFAQKDIDEGRLVLLSVPDAPAPLDPTPIVVGRLRGRSYSRFENEIIEFFKTHLNGIPSEPSSPDASFVN